MQVISKFLFLFAFIFLLNVCSLLLGYGDFTAAVNRHDEIGWRRSAVLSNVALAVLLIIPGIFVERLSRRPGKKDDEQ